MVAKSKPSAQSSAKQADTPAPDWKLAGLLTTLIFAARLLYIQFFCPYGLGPDEAQYWHWSLHPDWSYVTKPPLTTVLIWLSTAIFGQTEFAVRLIALLSHAATLLLGFAIARKLGGRSSGWWAFALLATAPLIGFSGFFTNPDAVLLPLYLGALLLLTLQLQNPTKPRWLALGALVGLAGLAKYSAVFFFPLAGLFALFYRHDWLKSPWFYLSGLLALALQTPVIYWNFAHHLEGLHHVAWQTSAGDSRHGGPLTVLNFLLGQFAAYGPIVFALMVAAATAATRHFQKLPITHKLVFLFSVPLFALFLLQNLFSKGQPNWPLLATVPAVLLLAGWLPTQNKFVKNTAAAGIALNAVLCIILANTVFFGIPNLVKPLRQMLGVRQTGTFTTSLLSRLEPGTVLLTSNYGTMARQAFYARGPLQSSMAAYTYYIRPQGARATQYDLWPWPSPAPQMALYVTEGENRALPTEVTARFKTCTFVTNATIALGQKPVRQATYYLCGNGK